MPPPQTHPHWEGDTPSPNPKSITVYYVDPEAPWAPRYSHQRRSATRRLRRLDPRAFGARPWPPFANPGSATGYIIYEV